MHKDYYHLNKIWCSYRATKNAFGFDTTGGYIGFTNMVAIFDTNKDYDLRYILALVNSRLLEYQHKNNAKQTGGGVYEYVPNVIEQYPIPCISLDEQKPFVELVEEIFAAKASNPSADISTYEAKLDYMVYELYGLSTEEIAYIESLYT